jgi:hypothetical protein
MTDASVQAGAKRPGRTKAAGLTPLLSSPIQTVTVDAGIAPAQPAPSGAGSRIFTAGMEFHQSPNIKFDLIQISCRGSRPPPVVRGAGHEPKAASFQLRANRQKRKWQNPAGRLHIRLPDPIPA